MRILHLTLKKRWYDMIASGEKKEEYREIKDYWVARLQYWRNGGNNPGWENIEFDAVKFKNGYGKDAPTLLVEWKGLSIGKPAFKWYGAEPKDDVYIIHLGEIITPQQ